jgi:hypothetical protein
MRPLADQLRAQRAETAEWIVDGLIARGSLRPETRREEAIDMVWLLMDPHGFCSLTDDRGWTPQRYERWFTDSVCRLLLDQTEPAAGTTPAPQHPIAAINQVKESNGMTEHAQRPSTAARRSHGADV